MKDAEVGDGSEGAAPVLRRRRRRSASGSNIGAATVFVNYDGVEKHRTVVGDDVRVGSDTMLVAPVDVGDGAYTAAGSVITDDVPPGALGVGRAKQRNIEGWVAAPRPGRRRPRPPRRGRRSSAMTTERPSEQGRAQ